VFLLTLVLSSAAFAPPVLSQTSAPASAPQNPQLQERPAPVTANPAVREGKISLDVVVNDAGGKPVTGLQPWDFAILDNDKPTKILSFRSFDGELVKPEPPVEVILLVDELNPVPQQVALTRKGLSDFLRQNDGHLTQPTSIMLLSDEGLRVQPRSTLDGLSLASMVNSLPGHVSSTSSMGAEGAIERFQRSVRALEGIAENDANSPRRRLLIWIGPGWPMLESVRFSSSGQDQRRFFDTIVELTNKLREARIVVSSVAPIDPTGASTTGVRYRAYLRGVGSVNQAEPGDLALKVIAAHTGGRVLGPDNDLVGQINQSVSDASAFYQLSFDPPATEKRDEYHALKVVVKQADASVRTSAGYYSEQPGN
jgi:VWFA-related protein